MSPTGYFLPTAAESTQRTPSKPMVLKSFARLGYRPYGKPSATRTGCVRLSPCLRIVSASTAAGRLRGPALARRGEEGCYVYRAAGCGHTPPPITHRPPAGHAGPALQKFPVGRHPCAPPQTVPSGGAEPRPYGGQGCLWAGRRGNQRSAASGGRSELISRKCPDWRTRQWPGIGWHDGGQPPPPMEVLPVNGV